MKKIAYFLVLVLSGFVHAITTMSISGVSASSSNATDGSWTVFGGIQKSTNSSYTDFTGCTATGTCNTCIGTSTTPPAQNACNKKGVFNNTIITITGSSSGLTLAPTAKWVLCDAGSDKAASADINSSLTITWNDLCTNAGSGDCETNDLNKSLTFGPAVDCNALTSVAATEKITIKFYTRAIDVNAASTYDPTDCAATTGACGFSLYPGDEKVYLEGDYVTLDPSTGNSGVPYTNVVFFYEIQTDADAGDDLTTFDRITTKAEGFKEFPITTSSSKNEIGGSSIGSLKNNKKYCFKMGTQDAAGNIERISSTDCPGADCNSSTTAANQCMKPSEVVGLLSDKECFIATAAFGSDMDQHVKMLRDFRNKFMAPHWIGRKLVKAYYSVSPPLAKWISQHENARSLTRWMLWPILGWANLALQFGWAVVVMPFFVLAFGFYFLSKKWELQ